MTTAKSQNEPIWDKKYSTYMRVIYLTNGYTLTGYSKKVGRNERRDKVDLLTNWILRDLKNGYLDRHTTNPRITPVDRIEYFFKRGESEYEPIINLYYDFPEWVNPKWMDFKKMHVFINRFYDMIRNQMSPTSIANALEIRTRAQSQDPLDISIPRFSSMPDLNAYIHRLKNESSLPGEAVDNFYRKYKEKYFFNK